jgi:hypothetical protein
MAHEIQRRGYGEELADRAETIRSAINVALLGVPREEDEAALRGYGEDYEPGDAERAAQFVRTMERRRRGGKGKEVDRGEFRGDL